MPKQIRSIGKMNLENYAGRWVALYAGKVIAQGGTPGQAEKSAHATRFKESVQIMYVPTSQRLVYPDLVYRLRELLTNEKQVYLVGGVVRDALLGRQSKDIDLVVSLRAIDIARKTAERLGCSFYPLHEEYDAARLVVITPENERILVDFTSMRGSGIEDDLFERDFSINALAAPLLNPNEILDPTGGIQDLLVRQIRVCTVNSLVNDPVRILRGLRLAATLGFKIEKETRGLMRKSIAGLEDVSVERKRDELFHLLAGEQPAATIRALDMLGGLPFVLPELGLTRGVQQSPPHTLDVFEHSLDTIRYLYRMLEILSPDYSQPEIGAENLIEGLVFIHLGKFRTQIHQHLVRHFTPDRNGRAILFFAALHHDIGKTTTQTSEEPTGRIRFFGHEKAGAELVAKRARLLHLSNQEVEHIERIVRHHMRPMLLANSDDPPTRRAIYRFFRDAGLAGVDICLLAMADFLASYHINPPQELWNRYLKTIRTLLEGYWETNQVNIKPVLFLDGTIIMEKFNLQPGPLIGELLEQLREAQAIGEITNREQALEFIQLLVNERQKTAS
jgi:tRNA nucleotidyltransferase/poly(A) polymerase